MQYKYNMMIIYWRLLFFSSKLILKYFIMRLQKCVHKRDLSGEANRYVLL